MLTIPKKDVLPDDELPSDAKPSLSSTAKVSVLDEQSEATTEARFSFSPKILDLISESDVTELNRFSWINKNNFSTEITLEEAILEEWTDLIYIYNNENVSEKFDLIHNEIIKKSEENFNDSKIVLSIISVFFDNINKKGPFLLKILEKFIDFFNQDSVSKVAKPEIIGKIISFLLKNLNELKLPQTEFLIDLNEKIFNLVEKNIPFFLQNNFLDENSIKLLLDVCVHNITPKETPEEAVISWFIDIWNKLDINSKHKDYFQTYIFNFVNKEPENKKLLPQFFKGAKNLLDDTKNSFMRKAFYKDQPHDDQVDNKKLEIFWKYFDIEANSSPNRDDKRIKLNEILIKYFKKEFEKNEDLGENPIDEIKLIKESIRRTKPTENYVDSYFYKSESASKEIISRAIELAPKISFLFFLKVEKPPNMDDFKKAVFRIFELSQSSVDEKFFYFKELVKVGVEIYSGLELSQWIIENFEKLNEYEEKFQKNFKIIENSLDLIEKDYIKFAEFLCFTPPNVFLSENTSVSLASRISRIFFETPKNFHKALEILGKIKASKNKKENTVYESNIKEIYVFLVDEIIFPEMNKEENQFDFFGQAELIDVIPLILKKCIESNDILKSIEISKNISSYLQTAELSEKFKSNDTDKLKFISNLTNENEQTLFYLISKNKAKKAAPNLLNRSRKASRDSRNSTDSEKSLESLVCSESMKYFLNLENDQDVTSSDRKSSSADTIKSSSLHTNTVPASSATSLNASEITTVVSSIVPQNKKRTMNRRGKGTNLVETFEPTQDVEIKKDISHYPEKIIAKTLEEIEEQSECQSSEAPQILEIITKRLIFIEGVCNKAKTEEEKEKLVNDFISRILEEKNSAIQYLLIKSLIEKINLTHDQIKHLLSSINNSTDPADNTSSPFIEIIKAITAKYERNLKVHLKNETLNSNYVHVIDVFVEQLRIKEDGLKTQHNVFMDMKQRISRLGKDANGIPKKEFLSPEMAWKILENPKSFRLLTKNLYKIVSREPEYLKREYFFPVIFKQALSIGADKSEERMLKVVDNLISYYVISGKSSKLIEILKDMNESSMDPSIIGNICIIIAKKFELSTLSYKAVKNLLSSEGVGQYGNLYKLLEKIIFSSASSSENKISALTVFVENGLTTSSAFEEKVIRPHLKNEISVDLWTQNFSVVIDILFKSDQKHIDDNICFIKKSGLFQNVFAVSFEHCMQTFFENIQNAENDPVIVQKMIYFLIEYLDDNKVLTDPQEKSIGISSLTSEQQNILMRYWPSELNAKMDQYVVIDFNNIESFCNVIDVICPSNDACKGEIHLQVKNQFIEKKNNGDDLSAFFESLGNIFNHLEQMDVSKLKSKKHQQKAILEALLTLTLKEEISELEDLHVFLNKVLEKWNFDTSSLDSLDIGIDFFKLILKSGYVKKLNDYITKNEEKLQFLNFLKNSFVIENIAPNDYIQLLALSILNVKDLKDIYDEIPDTENKQKIKEYIAKHLLFLPDFYNSENINISSSAGQLFEKLNSDAIISEFDNMTDDMFLSLLNSINPINSFKNNESVWKKVQDKLNDIFSLANIETINVKSVLYTSLIEWLKNADNIEKIAPEKLKILWNFLSPEDDIISYADLSTEDFVKVLDKMIEMKDLLRSSGENSEKFESIGRKVLHTMLIDSKDSHSKYFLDNLYRDRSLVYYINQFNISHLLDSWKAEGFVSRSRKNLIQECQMLMVDDNLSIKEQFEKLKAYYDESQEMQRLIQDQDSKAKTHEESLLLSRIAQRLLRNSETYKHADESLDVGQLLILVQKIPDGLKKLLLDAISSRKTPIIIVPKFVELYLKSAVFEQPEYSRIIQEVVTESLEKKNYHAFFNLINEIKKEHETILGNNINFEEIIAQYFELTNKETDIYSVEKSSAQSIPKVLNKESVLYDYLKKWFKNIDNTKDIALEILASLFHYFSESDRQELLLERLNNSQKTESLDEFIHLMYHEPESRNQKSDTYVALVKHLKKVENFEKISWDNLGKLLNLISIKDRQEIMRFHQERLTALNEIEEFYGLASDESAMFFARDFASDKKDQKRETTLEFLTEEDKAAQVKNEIKRQKNILSALADKSVLPNQNTKERVSFGRITCSLNETEWDFLPEDPKRSDEVAEYLKIFSRDRNKKSYGKIREIGEFLAQVLGETHSENIETQCQNFLNQLLALFRTEESLTFFEKISDAAGIFTLSSLLNLAKQEVGKKDAVKNLIASIKKSANSAGIDVNVFLNSVMKHLHETSFVKLKTYLDKQDESYQEYYEKVFKYNSTIDAIQEGENQSKNAQNLLKKLRFLAKNIGNCFVSSSEKLQDIINGYVDAIFKKSIDCPEYEDVLDTFQDILISVSSNESNIISLAKLLSNLPVMVLKNKQEIDTQTDPQYILCQRAISGRFLKDVAHTRFHLARSNDDEGDFLVTRIDESLLSLESTNSEKVFLAEYRARSEKIFQASVEASRFILAEIKEEDSAEEKTQKKLAILHRQTLENLMAMQLMSQEFGAELSSEARSFVDDFINNIKDSVSDEIAGDEEFWHYLMGQSVLSKILRAPTIVASWMDGKEVEEGAERFRSVIDLYREYKRLEQDFYVTITLEENAFRKEIIGLLNKKKYQAALVRFEQKLPDGSDELTYPKNQILSPDLVECFEKLRNKDPKNPISIQEWNAAIQEEKDAIYFTEKAMAFHKAVTGDAQIGEIQQQLQQDCKTLESSELLNDKNRAKHIRMILARYKNQELQAQSNNKISDLMDVFARQKGANLTKENQSFLSYFGKLVEKLRTKAEDKSDFLFNFTQKQLLNKMKAAIPSNASQVAIYAKDTKGRLIRVATLLENNQLSSDKKDVNADDKDTIDERLGIQIKLSHISRQFCQLAFIEEMTSDQTTTWDQLVEQEKELAKQLHAIEKEQKAILELKNGTPLFTQQGNYVGCYYESNEETPYPTLNRDNIFGRTDCLMALLDFPYDTLEDKKCAEVSTNVCIRDVLDEELLEDLYLQAEQYQLFHVNAMSTSSSEEEKTVKKVSEKDYKLKVSEGEVIALCAQCSTESLLKIIDASIAHAKDPEDLNGSFNAGKILKEMLANKHHAENLVKDEQSRSKLFQLLKNLRIEFGETTAETYIYKKKYASEIAAKYIPVVFIAYCAHLEAQNINKDGKKIQSLVRQWNLEHFPGNAPENIISIPKYIRKNWILSPEHWSYVEKNWDSITNDFSVEEQANIVKIVIEGSTDTLHWAKRFEWILERFGSEEQKIKGKEYKTSVEQNFKNPPEGTKADQIIAQRPNISELLNELEENFDACLNALFNKSNTDDFSEDFANAAQHIVEMKALFLTITGDTQRLPFPKEKNDIERLRNLLHAATELSQSRKFTWKEKEYESKLLDKKVTFVTNFYWGKWGAKQTREGFDSILKYGFLMPANQHLTYLHGTSVHLESIIFPLTPPKKEDIPEVDGKYVRLVKQMEGFYNRIASYADKGCITWKEEESTADKKFDVMESNLAKLIKLADNPPKAALDILEQFEQCSCDLKIIKKAGLSSEQLDSELFIIHMKAHLIWFEHLFKTVVETGRDCLNSSIPEEQNFCIYLKNALYDLRKKINEDNVKRKSERAVYNLNSKIELIMANSVLKDLCGSIEHTLDSAFNESEKYENSDFIKEYNAGLAALSDIKSLPAYRARYTEMCSNLAQKYAHEKHPELGYVSDSFFVEAIRLQVMTLDADKRKIIEEENYRQLAESQARKLEEKIWDKETKNLNPRASSLIQAHQREIDAAKHKEGTGTPESRLKLHQISDALTELSMSVDSEAQNETHYDVIHVSVPLLSDKEQYIKAKIIAQLTDSKLWGKWYTLNDGTIACLIKHHSTEDLLKVIHANITNSKKSGKTLPIAPEGLKQAYKILQAMLSDRMHTDNLAKNGQSRLQLFDLLKKLQPENTDDKVEFEKDIDNFINQDYPSEIAGKYIPEVLMAYRVYLEDKKTHKNAEEKSKINELLLQWDLENFPGDKPELAKAAETFSDVIRSLSKETRKLWFSLPEKWFFIKENWDMITYAFNAEDNKEILENFFSDSIDSLYCESKFQVFAEKFADDNLFVKAMKNAYAYTEREKIAKQKSRFLTMVVQHQEFWSPEVLAIVQGEDVAELFDVDDINEALDYYYNDALYLTAEGRKDNDRLQNLQVIISKAWKAKLSDPDKTKQKGLNPSEKSPTPFLSSADIGAQTTEQQLADFLFKDLCRLLGNELIRLALPNQSQSILINADNFVNVTNIQAKHLIEMCTLNKNYDIAIKLMVFIEEHSANLTTGFGHKVFENITKEIEIKNRFDAKAYSGEASLLSARIRRYEDPTMFAWTAWIRAKINKDYWTKKIAQHMTETGVKQASFEELKGTVVVSVDENPVEDIVTDFNGKRIKVKPKVEAKDRQLSEQLMRLYEQYKNTAFIKDYNEEVAKLSCIDDLITYRLQYEEICIKLAKKYSSSEYKGPDLELMPDFFVIDAVDRKNAIGKNENYTQYQESKARVLEGEIFDRDKNVRPEQQDAVNKHLEDIKPIILDSVEKPLYTKGTPASRSLLRRIVARLTDFLKPANIETELLQMPAANDVNVEEVSNTEEVKRERANKKYAKDDMNLGEQPKKSTSSATFFSTQSSLSAGYGASKISSELVVLKRNQSFSV